MSKRYSKQQQKNTRPKLSASSTQQRPPQVTTQEWEMLAGNSEMKSAYVSLTSEIARAHAEAEQLAARSGLPADSLLDFSSALALMQQHPQLTKFLYDVREHGAPFSHLAKSSPVANAQERNDTQGLGDLSGWTGDKHAPQGVVNSRLFRKYADENPWVRSAINKRREQVGRANISVAPQDERKRFDKKTQYIMQMLLDQPNEYRTNYYELIGASVEDLLVLDRGCLSKDMTPDRKPTGLYYEDGAAIKIYANWSGDPKEPRYLWEEPGGRLQVPLLNDELICMTMNPSSYRFGLSPVQVLIDVIKADLEATKTAMQMVSHKPPPQMVHLQGATPGQLKKVRDKYETEIAGEKEIFWVGGDGPAQVFPLVWSAKDQQFLEWQIYLARKICAVFAISPQQIGITFDINRATADSQQEIFEDGGLIPLLLLIEDYLNRELLGDFCPQLKDGRVDFNAINLRILFPEVSEADRRMHAKEAVQLASQALAGLPSMTLNQVLMMWGEEPVPGGNTFYAPQTLAPVPWLSYEKGETGDYNPASTSGAQGAQDAMGGPSASEEPTATPTEEPDNLNEGNSTNTPQNGNAASSGGEAGGSGSGSAQAGKQLQLIDTQDYRATGKRWTPSTQRSKRAESRRLRAVARVPEEVALVHHDPYGKIKAREEMRQATLDFYGAQTDAIERVLEQVGERVRGKLPPAEKLREELSKALSHIEKEAS